MCDMSVTLNTPDLHVQLVIAINYEVVLNWVRQQ